MCPKKVEMATTCRSHRVKLSVLSRISELTEEQLANLRLLACDALCWLSGYTASRCMALPTFCYCPRHRNPAASILVAYQIRVSCSLEHVALNLNQSHPDIPFSTPCLPYYVFLGNPPGASTTATPPHFITKVNRHCSRTSHTYFQPWGTNIILDSTKTLPGQVLGRPDICLSSTCQILSSTANTL